MERVDRVAVKAEEVRDDEDEAGACVRARTKRLPRANIFRTIVVYLCESDYLGRYWRCDSSTLVPCW